MLTSDVALLDGLVVHEARDALLVHSEALPRPRVLLEVAGPGLVPRAPAQEEHERHQDADHADLIKVSYKTCLLLSCGVSFDDIFSLMYYSTSGEEFGNEKATYLGYINVQCVHVHNSNNLIVISRSYLTYHDTNDSRGGGV